jgi:hypothetical protein
MLDTYVWPKIIRIMTHTVVVSSQIPAFLLLKPRLDLIAVL